MKPNIFKALEHLTWGYDDQRPQKTRRELLTQNDIDSRKPYVAPKNPKEPSNETSDLD